MYWHFGDLRLYRQCSAPTSQRGESLVKHLDTFAHDIIKKIVSKERAELKRIQLESIPRRASSRLDHKVSVDYNEANTEKIWRQLLA